MTRLAESFNILPSEQNPATQLLYNNVTTQMNMCEVGKSQKKNAKL